MNKPPLTIWQWVLFVGTSTVLWFLVGLFTGAWLTTKQTKREMKRANETLTECIKRLDQTMLTATNVRKFNKSDWIKSEQPKQET